MAIDERLLERLYGLARGGRWRVPMNRFATALESSAERAFGGHRQDGRTLERYFVSLHLEDLALACACAAGDEEAWESFVHDQRPLLYRAADALDSSGGARDLADALYAELFGLENRAGERRPLFLYFHGRSSLTTWLRAVLAQRYVDRLRADRRSDALPDEDSPSALAAPIVPHEPERERYLACLHEGLARAVAALAPRERLRLACYYAQGLTLAEIGRLVDEHEATVSRQLARTRARIREAVERYLRVEVGLSDAEIAQCLESAATDAGPLDLGEILEVGASHSREIVPSERKAT